LYIEWFATETNANLLKTHQMAGRKSGQVVTTDHGETRTTNKKESNEEIEEDDSDDKENMKIMMITENHL